ncbi:hypothetical protein PG990_004926 [Apiospora arundinis]
MELRRRQLVRSTSFNAVGNCDWSWSLDPSNIGTYRLPRYLLSTVVWLKSVAEIFLSRLILSVSTD